MIENEAVNRLQSFSWVIQGVVVGVILTYLALLNLDFGRFHIGFMFLPVMAIFFWPVQASYSWSLIGIFLVGLFHDIASDGPLGIWMLSYLSLYLIMGGGIDMKYSFTASFLWFVLSLMFIVLCMFTIGYISLGHLPRGIGVLFNLGTALALFPLVYWLRTLFGFARSAQSYRRNR